MKFKKTGAMLLCLLLCFGSYPLTILAQHQTEVLNRADDDRVTSRDERQQTVATLLAAARTARDNGESLKAARFLNRAGRLQLLLNLPEEALATYQEALETLKETDTATQIVSLNGIAAVYTYQTKCDQAQTAGDQAVKLSENTKNVPGKAQALLTLSECQNGQNHALALQTAHEALELWKSVDNKWGMGKTYSAIGHYQLTLQNLSESNQSHEAALAIWRELNIPYEEAQALINLGYVEFRKGAWQNAISFLLQGQALLDPQTHLYEMGQITINLGEIFMETNLPEAALSNLSQALEYFRQAKSPLGVAVVSWDMGKAYYQQGNYSAAVATLKQTIEDAKKIDQPNLIGMCHESLGQTYFAMNDPETALVHYQSALDLFTKISGPMEAARVRARMGQVYAAQKRFERANSFYEKALQTFRALTDRLNESATLYALGKLKLDQQDLDAAEQYLRQSIDVTEDIRRTPSTGDLTAAFSATIHERYERYIDCLMQKQKKQESQKLAITAFELSEKARVRSLKELLQATQTNLIPGVEPQLAHQERSLRQSLSVKENYKITLLSDKYDPKQLDTLETELAQLESQYKSVVQTIALQYPAYEKITQPSGWDLRRIQKEIVADDDTALLEYSIGAENSYVWVVTRNDLVSHELPSGAEITEAAQKVYALISEIPNAESEKELTQASNKLSNLVLKPLAESLGKRKLIVVADDVLNYIPFQILPAPTNNSELLIAQHEIINAPSASILGELRQEGARRQPAARVLAAFGDPVFRSNYAQRKGTEAGELVADLRNPSDRWQHALRDIDVEADNVDPTNIQPLFYTTRELANLREVAGSETLVVTGFDATRETLLNTDLTQYAIVHFATHGVLDPKRPENSGLFLSMVNRDAQSQNGFIGLQDIYGLNARVDLIVLSACRTGLGKKVNGEGLIGLTRGFMYAGASSTVASLWSVDDEATAELMKHFYSKMLKEDMTPAAALRAAQTEIRKDPRWSSPYYWAAFTFQGDYERHISAVPKSLFGDMKLVGVMGVTLLLLLTVAGWFWWRQGLRVKRRTSGLPHDYHSTMKR